MRTEPPLLAPIFRSEGQARLLTVALLDGEYSLSDLAERAGLAYPTAHREVRRLLESGILTERVIGRSRLIRANESSPLVPPLTDILQMTAGPAVLLRRELAGIDGIECAFIFGTFAARTLHVAGAAPNDIDVMVVGTPDSEAVYDACTLVEDQVRRPVNPTVLTHDEALADSAFLTSVRTNPIVAFLGQPPWQ
ncbi:MAG: winged helix-turn-helix domain-containing protein [Propionibacteriaceae bacterium]|jgi:DNA-binding transcriptional ArsR family regulator|nr:winged helix-turn-helix domain-containing protein [Propionibacteriaceae bacterium]